MRKEQETYVGIHNDRFGGMTDTGKIIRDAWVFEIIPEAETCEGWLVAGIEDLWRKVNAQWEQYGFSVGELPLPIRQRFMRIQDEAVKRARHAGWNPELSDD